MGKGKEQAPCLPEEGYAQQMREVVEPFLEGVRKSGTLAVKGGEIAYELYPQQEKADTVVISHGFSETSEKFWEFIYYLYQAGYQVAVWDHRGHGKSLREGKDDNVAHVEDFMDYVDDMRQLMEKHIRPFAKGGRLFLYAHSMGGCIGALYLEAYPKDFDRAILNAPMLAIQMGPCPLWAAKAISAVMKRLGKGEERLFTQKAFQPDEPFETSCTDSEARHFYYLEKRRTNPRYQTSSVSYSWLSGAIRAGKLATRQEQVERIHIPVLLIQAGKDDQVKPGAQKKFARYLPDNCILVRLSSVKHECYRSSTPLLEKYRKLVLDFYAD